MAATSPRPVLLSSDTPTESRDPTAGSRWEIRVLGALMASRGDETISNFSSRGVAALLARLALYPQRNHAREELIELLWPGVALDVGRNRLRQALFTLRQLLEPPGPIATPVLLADRQGVRVVAGAIGCDALRFEAAVRGGRHAEALDLYGGELLPGHYDEWIDEERLRLAALFDRAGRLATTTVAATSSPVPATANIAAAPRVAAGRTALPVYLTRFFGGDAEGARLREEVLSHRLVTLLGPGGSGKTRLAVELAAAIGTQAPERFDFIAFVPLVGCSTRAQLLDAMLSRLQLRPQGDDAFEPIVAALDGRRALLVLDNFEQLAGHGEEVVARLGAAIEGLHLLVTSRRVLGIDGEHAVAVQPLGLPRAGAALDIAAGASAVALFVDRARAARADFHIGPSNVEAIVDLVHLLEGMPLAIELAAARVRSIAPPAMRALLREARSAPGGHALQLLARSGPRSGSDPRHASMLYVVEWSWRLLAAAQARLLATLTVFDGGFSAAAAAAVCDLGAAEVALMLDDLVAQSMLRVEATVAGANRFAAFGPVREYAALQIDDGDARRARARHRAWLIEWAGSLPDTPDLLEVRAELANLLAGLASAIVDAAPDDAIRIALPLRRVLEDVELPAVGLASLAAAIEQSGDPALRARGHTLIGPLLFIAGQGEQALAHAEQGMAGTAEPPAARGRAALSLARVRWRKTRDAETVNPLLDTAETLAVASADLDLQAGVQTLRANLANGRRDYALAETLHARALELWERQGNRHAIHSGRYSLAVCAQNAGRNAQALERLDSIESSARQLHDWRRVSQMLNVRGNAQMGLQRWAEAAVTLRESSRLAWETLALHELAHSLWNLPRALAHTGQPEAALRLASFAARFWETRFGLLSRADLRYLRLVRRLAACRLEPRPCEQLWAEGARLGLAEAVAIALHG
ncbi:MAG: NB-ARC domain-containing protein [Caldimonas sp.]